MQEKVNEAQRREHRRINWQVILIDVLLVIIIIAGAYFRLVGVNWDVNKHLHPDERFLSMVQASIKPVEKASDYFNTELSSLNPHNRGYEFFVYGTLPIFIIRYIGEWTGQTDYESITILGRQLSAMADLLTVLLVFLIGSRLYKHRVGLIAATFYACAVLPIQLSHFMTVDTFTNTFGMLAVYAAVLIATRKKSSVSVEEDRAIQEVEPAKQSKVQANIIIAKESPAKPEFVKIRQLLKALWPYILFGLALGMATASKINAVALAFLLPIIEAIRYFKTSPSEREQSLLIIIRNVLIAAIVSLVVFRICQPYAFNGPGLFGLEINQKWWSSLQSLRAQASGESDSPPALQWARRPITFSWTNMVIWGFGLPLGLFAWVSYFGMVWCCFKGEWEKHLPIWVWTGFYFIWQATSWVRSMRYQMLVYPLLAIIAAWALVRLWDSHKEVKFWIVRIKPHVLKWIGIILTVLVILGTAAWAFAFTRIYTRPHTRVAATDWIYENVPGPINLVINTEDRLFTQPLPYRSGDTLIREEPYLIPFQPAADSIITSVRLPYVVDQYGSTDLQRMRVSLLSMDDPAAQLATGWVEQSLQRPENNWQGSALDFTLDSPVTLEKQKAYYLEIALDEGNGLILLNGAAELHLLLSDGSSFNQMLPKFAQTVRPGMAYTMEIVVLESGSISEVTLPHILDFSTNEDPKTVRLLMQAVRQEGTQTTEATLTDTFTAIGDGRGIAYAFKINPPLEVEAPQAIILSLSIIDGQGVLGISGSAPVHESSWDDALPLGKDGYIPYSDSGGIYRGDLNFELYWPDDESKRTRFETNLDQGDYIFISSNRQWGTTVRVPERYPLTSTYYRNLIGCPEDKDIVWCYNVAEPGLFQGSLGFELAAVFESFPNLGGLEFNSQFAEEAFTVYDHPKVLIFKKTAGYDPMKTREILRAVDLTQVISITAKQADDYEIPALDGTISPQSTLLLSEDRLEEQRENGTWSDLFDRESPINSNESLAVIALYLFVSLLGIAVYPLIRLALPGLPDKGYPFIRLAGLMLLAYLVWLAGSIGIDFSHLTIFITLIAIVLTGIILAVIQRKSIVEDMRKNWRYYLVIEGLALLAFLFFLYIRMGNPDLWHPYKGGEKPMDFSYLNAVLKSTTFPPYDPWFAGGYINYYYYGFVIVGVPIKFLGIIPSTAYNIILPIWYSMLFIGAFSVGWNLFTAIRGRQTKKDNDGDVPHKKVFGAAFWAGLATALFLSLLGNLGTVQLMINVFQRLGSGGAPIEGARIAEQLNWLLQGFVMFLKKTPLPLYPGDWYWFPSRVIPGEAITEFPFFTFIYADLHAHLIALPMAVFAVAWGISVLFSRGRWGASDGRHKVLSFVLSFLFGGIIIGALKPTNTWDFYTYLIFNMVILGYTLWRYYKPKEMEFTRPNWQKIAVVILPILLLVFITIVLYRPFTYWYGQGYSEVGYWTGDKTPLKSYLIHWGLFLFVILSWMIWESYHWMATTPMSVLKKLKPYKQILLAAGIVIILLLFGLLITKVSVAIIIVPVGFWAVILILRPGQSDGKRLILFMIGTALALTLAVELIYLKGDIGRMNVVFKFYMQAWVLFALSTGMCINWLLKSLRHWHVWTLFIWELIFFGLICAAAMFPLLGAIDKIRDRMTSDAPHTLDGMTYMEYSKYYDMGLEMDLSQDYWAIRWMQDNIQGSPVILEGQAYEYRWGNRYTIYTGLPGVVGWNWHQRQQRAILRSNIVQERVDEVGEFYLTEDRMFVEQFLEQYEVSYIVFGQLERAFFPGPGLDKFEIWDGVLWDEVFRYEDTVIYEVRR